MMGATGHGTLMRGEALREGLDRLVRDFDEIAEPDHGQFLPEDDLSPVKSAPVQREPLLGARRSRAESPGLCFALGTLDVQPVRALGVAVRHGVLSSP